MTFRPTEDFALELDRADPLRSWRDQFHIPPALAAVGGNAAQLGPSVDPAGPSIYLTGNSLGCQPKAVRAAMEQELHDWQHLGVEGHLHGKHPWLPYHEFVRESAARLVGALPREVVIMNSLTVNLHLLMVSFYRPTRERFKIVIEDTAFPSDSYAVQSQADFHSRHVGFDKSSAVIRLKPRVGEHALRTEDICETIEREGKSIALVMLGAVNYLTGQLFEMDRITAAGQKAGAIVGWDLAHAAGNVPLKLHECGGAGADFAAWCSYKYLNGGPGALAGAFVHERHVGNKELPQFAGWWGNDPKTRFKMGPDFTPVETADRWQLSNPPIFSLTPVMESLKIFDQVGMGALREKSLKLTAYMEYLIDQVNGQAGGAGGKAPIEIATPRDPNSRGCALSLILHKGPRESFAALKRAGAICDFREPNVIRAAPVPLYSSFHDVWRFAQVLSRVATGS